MASDDSQDITVVPKNDLSNYMSSIDFSKIVETHEHRYSSGELNEILGALKTRLSSEIKAKDGDIVAHVGMILRRAFFNSTSPKAKWTGQIEYTLNSGGAVTTYVLKDEFIHSAVKDCCKKFNKPNPMRAFCTSLQDCYLAMAQARPEMFKSKRATKVGAPTGQDYLTADFITGESSLLDNTKRATFARASEYAINRVSKGGPDGEIVSLFDYGR